MLIGGLLALLSHVGEMPTISFSEFTHGASSHTSSNSSSTPPRSSQIATQAWYEKENKGRALIAAQNAVKRDLNYPSSAKFEDSFWVGLNGGVVIPGSLQKQEYSVTSWVDSQNAFGATIRTKFIVFVKQVSDGRWEVMEDSEGTPQIGLESEGN